MLELYKALHPQILQLHIRWAQFRYLFTVSDKRMTVLSNLAPGFFAIIRDVLRDDAFIGISRLTDRSRTRRNSNLSIVTLVEFAEKSDNTELASVARNLLDQLLVRVENIRQWRDKWLAHTDFDQSVLEQPLPGTKVKRGDIDEALRLIREIMHLFAVHLSQNPVEYDLPIVPGDAEVLARWLEEHEYPK
jgi:hypothetical protein